MTAARPPLTAADVTPEWIEILRTIIRRDGIAVRAGIERPTIQLKSQTDNTWGDLMLENSGHLFTDFDERNVVLKKYLTNETND